jgi:hypothetical protein
MEQVMTTLLREVERRRASTAIIDITGVPAVEGVAAATLSASYRQPQSGRPITGNLRSVTSVPGGPPDC